MKLDTAVKAVGFVASIGVSTVVGHAIKATTPVDIGIPGKILVGTGTFVLCSIASDLADKYVQKLIKDAIAEYKKQTGEVIVVEETK